ncbi:MAG: hypothetical protein ACLUVC_08000 [Longibaculum sp.]
MAKLYELAEIKNGQILTRYCNRDAIDGTKIKVITPGSISNGIINHEDLGENTLKEDIEQSKLMVAEPGDIIIKLSTPYDSAIVREEDKGLVIPSFCAMIRCNEGVNKDYVLAVLNNKKSVDKLVNDISGIGMRVIKIGSIRELEIPDISIDKQEVIGSLYRESLKETELLRRIVKNQIKLINGIIDQELVEGK